MKLWEVMKLLEEDPTDVYEANLSDVLKCRMRVKQGVLRGYYYFEVFEGEKLIDKACNIGAFNGNAAVDLDWQLVKQPVTWQEAIEAWSEGKLIYAENKAGSRVYRQGGDNETMNLRCSEIADCKWYVEDVE